MHVFQEYLSVYLVKEAECYLCHHFVSGITLGKLFTHKDGLKVFLSRVNKQQAVKYMVKVPSAS